MSEQLIIEQCAPTLAGIKTANLFSCRYTDKNNLCNQIKRFNQSLSYKGVRMIPVKIEKNFALIYLYRPTKLENDLQDAIATDILSKLGYSKSNSGKQLVELMQRLRKYEEFPHEIGLFLGYPSVDVKGFIDNKAENCKYVGCWKVYGDAFSAKKRFENYKKCTYIYKEQYQKGKTIERLTVAV